MARAPQEKAANGHANWGATAFMVIVVSHWYTNDQKMGDSLLDGSLWSAVTNNDKPLHATFWPFGLMLTLHVINSVRSNGGYWAADIAQCVFTAFGGLMMKDLLAGHLTMPFLFANNEALLAMVTFCWYFVNHDVPLSNNFNAWNFVNDKVSKYVPMASFMNLCSLGFHSSILINAAMEAGTASNNFYNLPALGATIFTCVALHCANNFFDADGINFNLGDACSPACERAVVIAFWCGTNGLTTLPVVGTFAAMFTPWAEGLFGNRANFLMATILLDELVGHLYPFDEKPHSMFSNAVYRLTGVSASGGPGSPKPKDPRGVYYNENPHINLAVSVGMVVGLSVFYTSAGVQPTSPLDGTLWSSITNNEKVFHATHWPFGLMFTCHVINSVRSNGGYWAADLISCLFTAFGGLMMKDLLAGNFSMPCLFNENEAFLSLAVFCWYFVNHDIPFTDVNAWNTVRDTAGKYVPINRFLNLCSLGFNASILINAAMEAGTASNNFYHLPALAQIMFTCVALHCANNFFNTDGVNFNLGDGCSAACAQAAVVAFWCGTNGFGSFPVIGGPVGDITAKVEGLFNGRANFLFAMILLDELTGYLQKQLPIQLPDAAFDLAYKLTGVNDGNANPPKARKEAASGSDPNKNPLFVAGAVVGLSVACGMLHGATYTIGSLFDGSLWTSVTNNDQPLHATCWPFGLMLTLHVINSARSNGGYWAADIVQCTFTAFGGLMMKDLLAAKYTMPTLFANDEALLSLLMVCWYFVNHDIPFTGLNVWNIFSNAVNTIFPLNSLMNLCSLGFNASILINAAMEAGTASNNFYHLPALGATIFTCVALHCANDFFNTDGINFNPGESCSAACEQAAVAAFWCGTNGLANLPVVGSVFPLLGVVTHGIEGFFGGRANFLMTIILLEAVAGHLSKHKRPHTVFADFLYNLTGVSAN